MMDKADPTRDLLIERDVPVPPEALWRGWTEPDLLKRWFCPLPWRVTEARIDLRPGGVFFTRMAGPEGEAGDCGPATEGCYLVVEANRRLVWTDALGPGFRPNPEPFMTAEIRFERSPAGGTHYRAVARHATAEACRRHADMGFAAGWNAALDQLVALCREQVA
jgi:uncharacterized protein YndB with AHSA1/START domain